MLCGCGGKKDRKKRRIGEGAADNAPLPRPDADGIQKISDGTTGVPDGVTTGASATSVTVDGSALGVQSSTTSGVEFESAVLGTVDRTLVPSQPGIDSMSGSTQQDRSAGVVMEVDREYRSTEYRSYVTGVQGQAGGQQTFVGGQLGVGQTQTLPGRTSFTSGGQGQQVFSGSQSLPRNVVSLQKLHTVNLCYNMPQCTVPCDAIFGYILCSSLLFRGLEMVFSCIG